MSSSQSAHGRRSDSRMQSTRRKSGRIQIPYRIIQIRR